MGSEKAVKLQILILFTTICSNLFSQNITLSADKMNILYANVSNPLSYTIVGNDVKKYSLECTNGKISGSNGRIILTPDSVGVCYVIFRKAGSRKVIYFPFRVKSIFDNTAAFLGTIRNDTLSLANFRSFTGVNIKPYEEFYLDAPTPKIKSFEIVITYRKRGIVSTFTNTGNTYTEEVKKAILEMEVGDFVSYSNILIDIKEKVFAQPFWISTN